MSSPAEALERAAALYVAGRLSDAEPLYRQVLAADPGVKVARDNLIALLRAQRRWPEAEAQMREALALAPDDADQRLRLAHAALAAGAYAEGWELYEARRTAKAGKMILPPLPMPDWTGGPVESLLVWKEQGFGDVIQFARFLPQLAERGIRTTLLCQPELTSLLTAAGLNAVPSVNGAKLEPHDAWTLVGSLPLRLGARLDNLPPPLAVRTRKVAKPSGIGVVTTGAPGHVNDTHRSMPADLGYELLQLPGAVSLAPADTGAKDFQATAEIIAGLERVITVDTAVAHLAGSMGKPTAILLPWANTDWRWLRERDDSPWYPSVRLYRQPGPGDWRAVLNAVIADLPAAARKATKRTKAPAPATPSPAPATARSETERRREVISAGGTDRQRWEDARQLDPAWDGRAQIAAARIPRGAAVLDLGCGAMALERFLPTGCSYQPCDLAARDARTIVCDFNAGEFPTDVACDIVSVLGVLEYIYDAPAFLAKLAALNRPVVMSYCMAGERGPADRRALGWVNDFAREQLGALLAAAGFGRITGEEVTPGQLLLRIEPRPDHARPEKSVWVLSYNNIGNFGDRLGGQILNQVLPPNARVRHIHYYPWDAPPEGGPEGAPDLLILGIGNSVFRPLLTDDLLKLVDRAGRTVGIFGTQYREAIDPSRMASLLDRLDSWWGRYEEDLLLYGKGRANARHLGDWLIEAFPMASWTRDELLQIGAEVHNDAPLDRLIERYQSYRRVASPRLHPLLCALTAAEEVAYQDQREMPDDPALASGKFRSMLLDVFGADKPERRMWSVDRAAVAAYKAKVRGNVEALRAELARVLG